VTSLMDLPPDWAPPAVVEALRALHRTLREHTDWTGVQITFNHMDMTTFEAAGLQIHALVPDGMGRSE
jgi:hypothetical protein